MADRDVTIDILARDKTGSAIQSTNRNLKSVEKSWKDVDGQAKRTIAAAQKIAGDWGRSLTRVSGATKRWADSGDGAGKKFVKGLFSGIEKVGDLGSSIGGSLSKAVSAAGPYVQVAMAALLVGAVLTAAPAIAGAIVGGAGLGGVVGGLIIAAKDARVASAFDDLKEDIGSGLQDAAKSFIPAALDAIDVARDAFDDLLPHLRRLFDTSSTWVAPLTRSLGRAAESLLSGITDAVTKAGPIIAVIGQGIELVAKRIGEMFSMLSDNGQSMALALKFVFALVAGAIQQAAVALNFLVEAFEFFVKRLPGGKALLDSMKSSQDSAKTSAYSLGGGFQALADDANGAANGITSLKQKADDLANSNISLARAQIASRDAIRQASDALKENSKAKLTNKERADRNMTALLNMADAFNTEADAGDRSGISAHKASEAYATNRAKLIAMAEKAHYSKQAAEELANRLLKIPKNVNTDVNVNTAGASAKLETFIKRARQADGTVINYTVRVTSTGDHHIPGQGKQLKGFAGYQSWQGAGDNTGGTSRSGGPTVVQNTFTPNITVLVDGKEVRAVVKHEIAAYDRQQRIGRR
ncbi:hypothetical protein KBX03_07580 [Micromonospora sp. C72]|uniref:hypothetical protein n=1 Tax=Micromonospora sp. C72 TaxID=2824880 RepID=UPI001B381158|nr:hypothetical protein [Micromonospora sp. C72]MBQ1042364.1 hypothetical protein [Micromonospora sp. C72]